MVLDFVLSDPDVRRQLVEFLGFMAAGTTVTAFYCRSMLPLRLAAIAANVLFIAYGALLDLKPVLALYCVLLPLNLIRLAGASRERAARQGEGARP